MILLLALPISVAMYLLGVFIVARELKGIVRWSFSLVALALPLWEVIPKQQMFDQLCRTQSGLERFAPALPVDSVWLGRHAISDAERFLLAGYSYVEGIDTGSSIGHPKFVRLQLDESAKVTMRSINTRTTPYEFELSFEYLGLGIFRRDRRIKNGFTGDVLVTFVGFKNGPSWWARVAGYHHEDEAASAYCPDAMASDLDLFLEALPPSAKQENQVGS
jgi:hypothetical protein